METAPSERRDEPHPGMRRGRRRARDTRGVSIAVNLAPMIDVTFLLLTFFLVTTTFERAEGVLSSQMPQDRGQPAPALPISPIVVRLDQVGLGEGDFTIRIDRFAPAPVGFSELTDALRALQSKPGFDTETPVVIVAGEDVLWDHVVGAWNAAVRADCKRIAFAEP